MDGAHWPDPEKPITTIVADTDHRRTFILGSDWTGDKDKRFWFEMAPAPKPREVNEKDWPKQEGTALPLRPLLEFALYLRNQKQLKAP